MLFHLLLLLGLVAAGQIPIGTSAYNKDEIVALINNIATSLNALDVSPNLWYGVREPAAIFDTTVLEELIERKVLTLIQRLPVALAYSDDRPHFMPGWALVNYTQHEELRAATAAGNILDASELVILTHHLNLEWPPLQRMREAALRGETLTLDDGMWYKNLQTNYKAWPTQPAFFQAFRARLKEGRDVPNYGRIVALDNGDTSYLDLQTRLIEDFHWPTNHFRITAWKAMEGIDNVVAGLVFQLHMDYTTLTPRMT